MNDPSSENKTEPSETQETPSVLPDEYPIAQEPAPVQRHLPSWIEKKRTDAIKTDRPRPRKEESAPYPFRQLILLITGLTGFWGLVCIRYKGTYLALGIIILGLLVLSGLIVAAVVHRRREAANQPPADTDAPKKADGYPLRKSLPAEPPFQFTLADLLITTTAMACLMSLVSMAPGANKLIILAGVSGAGVFFGLIVVSLADEVHRLFRLGWFMLFIIYIFSSAAAVFTR